MTYIFGVDIGYEDSDAIAVLGYHSHKKTVYVVEEVCKPKQDITSLVEQIKDLKNKYNPVKIVMDAGALGKKIQEEILYRHSLFIHAAEKARKVEFIELLNDDLRNNKFFAKKDSLFAEDCGLVQWDRDSRIYNPENPKISTVYHSDICDAVLYAWRECRHYLSEFPAPDTPSVHSTEYMNYIEQKEAQKMKARAEDPNHALFEALEKDMEELDKDLGDF